MIAYVEQKTRSVIWDFEAVGGGISTINLGRFIEKNAIITAFRVAILTTFESAGLATVEFGWVGNTNKLFLITGFASFTAPLVLAGRDFNLFASKTTAARELAITIADADLTAGKCLATIEYQQHDI